MASTTENVKLGACTVSFDNFALGLTKGGVEVEVSTASRETVVDQYGQTPIGELIQGRTVTVTVPVAESALEVLVKVIPGAVLETDGAVASGHVRLMNAPPVDGDNFTLVTPGITFTYRGNPTGPHEIKIGPTAEATVINTVNAINATNYGYTASSSGGPTYANIRARQMGNAWHTNINFNFATPGNFARQNVNASINPTYARLKVPTAAGQNLLGFARELVCRPIGTNGNEDFIVPKAATAGDLNFTYSTENERIYQVQFKGYVTAGEIFRVGAY